MLKALIAVMDVVNLSISFSKKEDKISLIIIPRPKDKDANAIKVPPLCISGTVEEIEENLAEVIQKAFITSGFTTNLDALTEDIKSKVNKKTTSKVTKKTGDDKDEEDDDAGEETTDTTTAGKKDDKKKKPAEKLNPKQTKAWEKIKVMVTKSKETLDVDMISYYEKQAEALAVTEGIPKSMIESLKANFETVRTELADKLKTPAAAGMFEKGKEELKATIENEIIPVVPEAKEKVKKEKVKKEVTDTVTEPVIPTPVVDESKEEEIAPVDPITPEEPEVTDVDDDNAADVEEIGAASEEEEPELNTNVEEDIF